MRLRIGLVDTGFIAEYQIAGFAADARCRVTGVTRTWRDNAPRPPQAKKLQDFAQKHNIQAYDSFEQMIGSDEIDAVVIGSINPYHYSQIMQALEKGKHVLVEKPVVNSIVEYAAIREKAASAKRLVIPAHNFACRGAFREAKRRVRAGELGRIQYGSFTESFLVGAVTGQWRSKHELAWGGALIDSGTHLVYQVLQLLGMPTHVQAFTARNVFEMEDEDIASVQLQYASGTIVHLMQNWGSNHGGDVAGIRLIGTEGRLTITDALYVNGEAVDHETSYADSFAGQAKAFADSVLDGAPPVSGLDDGEHALRIVQAAYESAKKGITVAL